ncbi:MAG: beta-lactamase family protein [Bacteroidales bacterium]|nr:beta-lactamase family protein [Bacteroidales bacterium]
MGRSCDRKIDDMVHGAIENKIIPGCQILAMSHGKLVYYKNFGYLKYDSILPVNSQTMYDVASMTKSLATTLAVMKLYDNHDLRLTDTVGMYLDYAAGTGVGKLTLAELLTHTSGLAAFVPFYREISPKGVWDSSYLCSQYSDTFCVQVADHVFLRYDYPDTVRHKLAIYRLNEKKYVYSDLGFVLLKEIVEKIAHQPMDSFLMEKFYVPMGLTRTGFNPRNWTCADNIAPTEEDRYFRKQVLQGYVHDQTAAVFGGVCGNAGLFSTASEVAAILQMLMNEGSWQGKCYLSPLTVKQFVTTCPMHGCQRRGLGFDTPSFAKPNAVLPEASSRRTFGHQGFTGTVFWCDPEEDFIYIFLSNRVYPSAEENKLSKSRLRLLVHEEILKALHAEKQ